MQSSKEFVRPLQSRTPGKAYPAARLYILLYYISNLEIRELENLGDSENQKNQKIRGSGLGLGSGAGDSEKSEEKKNRKIRKSNLLRKNEK